MKFIKFILIIALAFNISCRDVDNPLGDFFRDPPVSPLTQVIKTNVPIGYAATLAMAHFAGYDIPNASVSISDNVTIITIDVSTEYPYQFKGDTYNEMVIAGIKTSEDVAIVSIFFTDANIITGDFRLLNVETFPVILEEDKILAVIAGNEVNMGSQSLVEFVVDEIQIDDELDKLDTNKPSTTEIAINQNGWIIEVFHNNTLADFTDDEIVITGGQQVVDVYDNDHSSSTSAWQMGMLNAKITPACIANPKSGDAFLQEVSVSSSESLEDLIFGKVWYTFHNSCDGDVEITVATGNYITAIGKELDLGLN